MNISVNSAHTYPLAVANRENASTDLVCDPSNTNRDIVIMPMPPVTVYRQF
jgi:hypothetical protein